MKYRSEIDGLRAVAVVPVVLFHGGFALFQGGYVGVDVFFVISGYLITSIILGDLRSGRFSLLRFYERRVRRIFPALFFMLAGCAPAAWISLAPNDLEDFGRSVVAVTLFCSNILFWSQSDYFDTAAELKPLLHTWSLAVEEQYYVLFPLLLASMRSAGYRLVLGALGFFAIGSLALAVWGSANQPEAAFFLLPTRAWEILLGAMAALYAEHQGRLPDGAHPVSQCASMTGIVMIGAAVFGFDANTPTPGLPTLLPTVGTVLILVFATTGSLVARLLSTRGVVGIGLISYSVYLWHQPLFAFSKHVSVEPVGLVSSSLLALLAFVLGFLSWRFVEQPFRVGQNIGRKALFRMALVGSVAFMLAGAAGVMTHGFAGRRQFASPGIPGYDFDNKALTDQSLELLRDVTGDRPYRNRGSPGDRRLWFTGPDDVAKVLIVGNSHSIDLYNVFALNNDRFPHLEFARFGMQISDIGHANGEALCTSPNYKAADVILISTHWSNFRFEAESRGRSDFEGFEALVKRVTQDGKLLVLASETPQFPQFGNLTLADSLVLKWSRLHSPSDASVRECVDFVNLQYFKDLNEDKRTRQTNEKLRKLALHHRLIFLDKEDIICDKASGTCLAILESGKKTYRDSAHFTLEGAHAFGERAAASQWLEPLLRALAARTGG